MNTTSGTTISISGKSGGQLAEVLARLYQRVRREGGPVLIADDQGVVRMDRVTGTDAGERQRRLKEALEGTCGVFGTIELNPYLQDIRQGRGEEGSALS